MNLTYLTTGKSPSKNLCEHFDDIRMINVEKDNLHQRVAEIEGKMKEAGSKLFDINDFILYDPELEDLGEVVARNRLNAGVLSANAYDPIKIGNQYIKPTFKIGDADINLTYASRLPFRNNQRILFIGPHFEEETAIAGAYMHKKAGDDVHILFVTDIPNNPGWEEKSHGVYKEVVGLSREEYSFMGIPDRGVFDNRGLFKSSLEKTIRKFEPTAIIIPPEGSNFDHKYSLRFTYDAVQEKDIDFLVGEVVQDTRLRPTLWSVLDWSHVEKISTAYGDGKFGDAAGEHNVRNLFRKLPEGLNRYEGALHKDGKRANQFVGVFGWQPVRVTKGYQIPHATTIFDN